MIYYEVNMLSREVVELPLENRTILLFLNGTDIMRAE